MTEPLTVYMRKGCRTCSRALDRLEEKGVVYRRVDLLEDPPTGENLRILLRKLGLSARDLLRPRDRMYRELNLRERDLPDEELLALLEAHPGLVKRPILVRGERAALGLSKEDVDAFLEG